MEFIIVAVQLNHSISVYPLEYVRVLVQGSGDRRQLGALTMSAISRYNLKSYSS